MRKLLLDVLDRVSVGFMRHAPHGMAQGYGSLIARHVAPRLYPAAGQRARENLARLRPDLEVEAALAQMWECIARSMLEVPRAIRLFDEGRVQVVGAEHLSPRPLIVAALHLGNWEMVGLAMVRAGAPPVAFYQPQPSDYRTRIVVAERIKGGGRLLPLGRDGARPALHALTRDREVLLLFPDENQHGRIAAPSLGRGPRMGGNIENAIRLARIGGAPIVIGHCERLMAARDGPRFRVTFEAPMAMPREVSVSDGVADLDARIEAIILAHLPQWLMLTDWQPEG